MVTLDIDKETCGNIGGFNPCDVCDYKRCKNCILYELVMKFIGHKAADVAPVVHGRWIDGKCTNCGDEAPDFIAYIGCELDDWEPTPYCPNCGARMDGDTNGN